ncbi:hypothetical protein C2S51_037462 [Perilla frutescens var. frutescens]|nr:hypothetical protein C2S51_037462 [Perilla frutescens var. frutescens]
MDVDDEWELLGDDGFLEMNDGDGQIYSLKSAATVFEMNYFICPAPPQFVETTTRLLPPPPPTDRDQIKMMEEECNLDRVQEPISQVFFKKMMKEAEFVDIKVDQSHMNSAIVPQIGANFQLEEKAEMEDEKEGGGGGGGGEGLWKRISAICSFGVAAATFCIIVFTNKHPHRNHNLHFRIYTDEKLLRMKTMAAVRGVPISRARITVGGYYDASLSLSLSP